MQSVHGMHQVRGEGRAQGRQLWLCQAVRMLRLQGRRHGCVTGQRLAHAANRSSMLAVCLHSMGAGWSKTAGDTPLQAEVRAELPPAAAASWDAMHVPSLQAFARPRLLAPAPRQPHSRCRGK